MQTVKIKFALYYFLISFFCLLFASPNTHAKSVFTLTPASNNIKIATTGSNTLSIQVKNTSGVSQTITNSNIEPSLDAFVNASISSNTCLGTTLNNNQTCNVTVLMEGKGSSGNSELDLVICAYQGALCSNLLTNVQVETAVLTCSEAGGKVIDGATACWIKSVINVEPFHCSSVCAQFGKNIQSPGPINNQTLAENVIHTFNSNSFLYTLEITASDNAVYTGIFDEIIFKEIYVGLWSQQNNTDWNNPNNIIVDNIGTGVHCPCEPDA